MALLPEQVPRSMVHVVVGKSRHGEVAVIVTVLPSDIHPALALGRFLEILRQQLPLLVEIIGRALPVDFPPPPSASTLLPYRLREPERNGGRERTTSIRISSGSPFQLFTNSVASCSAHLALSSSPK